MKNVIIFVLFCITVVTGYLAAASRLRLNLEGLEGKTAKILRGSITLPVNATGEVRPLRRVEIKSEASGEVIEIAKHGGDRVKAGDLLIRLNKDDEQRSVDRARQELQIAEARLAMAKINLDQARTADLQAAEAQVAQLEPTVELNLFKFRKNESLPPEVRNAEEDVARRTLYENSLAQLAAARANVEKVRLNIPRAEEQVRQEQAAYEAAQATLGDVEKRLSKTDIVTPIHGVVADIKTQIGEVIQGGKTTLTGGTVLAIILDMDTLIVRGEVDESDIGRVLAIAPPWARPGHDGAVQMPTDLGVALQRTEHPPTISVESFRDQEFVGVIQRIYPEPKSLSNVVTYMVDVVITSDNRSILLPGMRADVRFTAEHASGVVLCPNEAIHEGPDGRLGVYIPRRGVPASERETEFVAVRLGLDDGNNVEIREGLTEGDVVYTKLPAKTDRDDKKKSRASIR